MKHFIALSILGVLLVPSIATADHVHEAQAPILDAGLQLGPYPGIESDPHPCDGSPFDWQAAGDKIRIEPWVLTPNKEEASEHWSYRLQVFKPDDSRDGLALQWDDFPVTHQNKPPHTVSKRFDVSQTNQYLLSEDPGTWEVRFRLDGMESEAVFEDVCRFTVLAP